jgi:hypothetical protein
MKYWQKRQHNQATKQPSNHAIVNTKYRSKSTTMEKHPKDVSYAEVSLCHF